MTTATTTTKPCSMQLTFLDFQLLIVVLHKLFIGTVGTWLGCIGHGTVECTSYSGLLFSWLTSLDPVYGVPISMQTHHIWIRIRIVVRWLECKQSWTIFDTYMSIWSLMARAGDTGFMIFLFAESMLTLVAGDGLPDLSFYMFDSVNYSLIFLIDLGRGLWSNMSPTRFKWFLRLTKFL